MFVDEVIIKVIAGKGGEEPAYAFSEASENIWSWTEDSGV